MTTSSPSPSALPLCAMARTMIPSLLSSCRCRSTRREAVGRWGSWCGFLIAREIVETSAYPERSSSGGLKTPNTATGGFLRPGFQRRVIEEAVVHHDAIRQDGDLRYVEVLLRSSEHALYHHWHIMHKAGRYPKNFSRLVGRALFRQRQDRIACLVAVGHSLIDGATGRLGIRYPTVAMHDAICSSPLTGSASSLRREPPGAPKGGRAPVLTHHFSWNRL